MAKGTKEQIESATRQHGGYGPEYSRIGQCFVPHCRTLQPLKNMYGQRCYFHARIMHYWAKKTGFDMSIGRDASIAAYCNWLKEGDLGKRFEVRDQSFFEKLKEYLAEQHGVYI